MCASDGKRADSSKDDSKLDKTNDAGNPRTKQKPLSPDGADDEKVLEKLIDKLNQSRGRKPTDDGRKNEGSDQGSNEDPMPQGSNREGNSEKDAAGAENNKDFLASTAQIPCRASPERAEEEGDQREPAQSLRHQQRVADKYYDVRTS